VEVIVYMMIVHLESWHSGFIWLYSKTDDMQQIDLEKEEDGV
jgi:glycogen synthase